MNTTMRIFSVFLLSAFVMCVSASRSIEGKEIALESFAKDKVTLLVFGTTWCPSCRHEVPILKEYYDELKDDGLKVLGIDVQESKKRSALLSRKTG